MSRLTDITNTQIMYGDDTPYAEMYVAKDDTRAIQKLGKLEDLEQQIGCPLEVVLIPYFISGLKKVWYHNQWCDVVRVVAYEEATTPYMEVRCKDYDYLKFIPLTNYKKTFWLKEDKSE